MTDNTVTTPAPSAPDYTALIDDETWAFIRACEACYPPDTATFTMDEQRAVYDRLCRSFYRGRPEGIATGDRTFGNVPCRLYRLTGSEAAPVVVYFHGGGFVVGGLDSHDDICAEICAATGCPLVSVDYRLAPEHRHPAHYDDALAATRAVADEFGAPLVLCGDSAGGTLAASVAHGMREADANIIGQLLIYPALGGDVDSGSYIRHAHAPLLTRDDMLFYCAARFPDGAGTAADVTAWPLDDTDYSGLPSTVVFTAECDPLADDGRDYTGRIRAAGGNARLVEEPGLVHGYLRARASVSRARASFARITEAVAALASGEPA